MSPSPRIIVLMGPAGAGKTTIGLLLAQSLGWRFLDADDFHSPENIARMRQGIALTDADRAPWLASIRDALEQVYRAHSTAVLACSALKEEYRAALTPDDAQGILRFVYLRASPKVLEDRLAHRVGHYAGPELLQSQLATLEEPPDALWVDASREPAEIVREIRDKLSL